MYAEATFRGMKEDMYPPSEKPMCSHRLNGYGCTRAAGHRGVHRAGTQMGVWCAEWDDDRSTDEYGYGKKPLSEFFDSIGL